MGRGDRTRGVLGAYRILRDRPGGKRYRSVTVCDDLPAHLPSYPFGPAPSAELERQDLLTPCLLDPIWDDAIWAESLIAGCHHLGQVVVGDAPFRVVLASGGDAYRTGEMTSQKSLRTKPLIVPSNHQDAKTPRRHEGNHQGRNWAPQRQKEKKRTTKAQRHKE